MTAAREEKTKVADTESVAADDTVTTPKRRVLAAPAKELSEPVWLIHHGKSEVEVPEVRREVVINDPEDPHFGEVAEQVVAEAYVVKSTLPDATRFGRRKIKLAHPITNAAEVEALKARGFVVATAKEIAAAQQQDKSANVDAMAAQQRKEAERRARRGVARTDDDDDAKGRR